MARASIWIVAASILAAFDITKAVDDNGNVIEPSGEYSSGFITCVELSFYHVSGSVDRARFDSFVQSSCSI